MTPTTACTTRAPRYGPGATTATATSQPTAAVHLGHTAFGWTGGANGIDRPVDRAFVTIQRAVQAPLGRRVQ